MTDLVASRFRLLEVLGQGAMGVVWRAHDTVLDRVIALKELHPPPGLDAADAVGRFLVEARAAARLAHPNIVNVHDVFLDGDRVLIVMELVEGRTLGQVSATGPQAASLVRAIMAQVAQALAAAHRAGVVHRDLKPDNIFWTAEGRAVVADFGLARIGAGRGTVDGTIMGTPGYMAPEQLKGTATTGQTDVFGWGAVAYQLATGRPPFGEPSQTDVTALAYRIVHEDPSPLALPGDPTLAALVMRSLAKQPHDRPSDGGELVAALAGGHWPPRPEWATSTSGSERAPWLVPVLAAAVVLVTVVLLVTVAASRSPDVSSEARTATTVAALATQPTSVVTTTVPTTTTTTRTTPPPTQPPRALPTTAGVLEAGPWATRRFATGLRFAVEPGWKLAHEEAADYIDLSVAGLPESVSLSFLVVERVFDPGRVVRTIEEARDASRPRVRDLAGWLRSHPRLQVTDTAKITKAGVPGERLEAKVSQPYDYEHCVVSTQLLPCVLLFQLSVDFFAPADNRFRFYVLDIGTAGVLVSIEAPAPVFEAFAAAAERVLETLRFT